MASLLIDAGCFQVHQAQEEEKARQMMEDNKARQVKEKEPTKFNFKKRPQSQATETKGGAVQGKGTGHQQQHKKQKLAGEREGEEPWGAALPCTL